VSAKAHILRMAALSGPISTHSRLMRAVEEQAPIQIHTLDAPVSTLGKRSPQFLSSGSGAVDRYPLQPFQQHLVHELSPVVQGKPVLSLPHPRGTFCSRTPDWLECSGLLGRTF
jgi:hypothetical protein